MKIAIVDDMHRDRICLASYIKKYFSTRNVPYEIVEFSSGEEFWTILSRMRMILYLWIFI